MNDLDITFTARLGRVRVGDTARVRRAIGKNDGDDVEIHLSARLD